MDWNPIHLISSGVKALGSGVSDILNPILGKPSGNDIQDTIKANPVDAIDPSVYKIFGLNDYSLQQKDNAYGTNQGLNGIMGSLGGLFAGAGGQAQLGSLSQMQGYANGSQETAADSMLRQAQSQNNMAIQAQGQSMGGQNPLLALRGILNAQSVNNGNTAGQLATQKLQEQFAAAQNVFSMGTQFNTQQQGILGQQAGLLQQTYANTNNTLNNVFSANQAQTSLNIQNAQNQQAYQQYKQQTALGQQATIANANGLGPAAVGFATTVGAIKNGLTGTSTAAGGDGKSGGASALAGLGIPGL